MWIPVASPMSCELISAVRNGEQDVGIAFASRAKSFAVGAEVQRWNGCGSLLEAPLGRREFARTRKGDGREPVGSDRNAVDHDQEEVVAAIDNQ